MNIGRLSLSFCLFVASVAHGSYEGAAQRTGNHRYGDCIMAAMPKEAHEAVMSTLNNGRFNQRYGDRMRKACNGVTVSPDQSQFVVYQANSLRFILADSLIRAHYAQSGPLDFSSVQPLWHVPALKPYSNSGGHRKEINSALRESASRRFLSVYGECIARENPETVRRLLLTPWDSSEQRQYFERLQPQLSSCLNNGVSLQLDSGLIRESLAYNYYRLAAAVNPAAQGSK